MTGELQLRDHEGRPLDVIELRALRVECIVGVYPAERHSPQPLVLDLSLYLDTRRAASMELLRETVDYARLAGELRFLLQSARFQLLETAAEALARYVLLPPSRDRPLPRIHAVALRLEKPLALPGAIPSLRVFRTAAELQFTHEEKSFGRVDIVHESRGCGIYRLRVAPGRHIPRHAHHVMDESELVLGDGLLLQGKPVRAGWAHRWPHGLAHRYDNPTGLEQSILCVDRPPFIPGDEVEIGGPPGPAPDELPEGVQYYPFAERALPEEPWQRGLQAREEPSSPAAGPASGEPSRSGS